jgi:glycogen phosphorylase
VQQQITRIRQLADTSGGYVYSTAVSAARPATDYTVRAIPHCPGVAVSLKAENILSQQSINLEREKRKKDNL